MDERFVRTALIFGEDGMRCAVGVLIDEKAYAPVIEGEGAGEIHQLAQGDPDAWRTDAFGALTQVLVESLGPKTVVEAADLLEDLQTVHDDYHVQDWPEALERAAIRHGLNP